MIQISDLFRPNDPISAARGYYENTAVNIVDERRHYVRILRGDGSHAWVNSNRVQNITPDSSSPASDVRRAPYPSGGSSPNLWYGGYPASDLPGRRRMISEFSESDGDRSNRRFALNAEKSLSNCKKAFKAAKLGKPSELEGLIKKGVPVNCTPYGNQTLAYIAALKGNLECLKVLYAAGADLTGRNRGDFNALHVAASSGNLDILRWMHGRGIRIMAYRTPQGEDCLQLAANRGHRACVKFLKSITKPQKPEKKTENIDELLNRIDRLDEEKLENVLSRVVKNLRQKRMERSRHTECVVCMSAEKEYSFDCGHLCCCQTCMEKITKSTRTCPICRKRVHKSFRVYT